MLELDALVLAAGRGTRMPRLSARRPKPLFPVGATTPMALIVERLRAGGAGRVVANACHLASQIVRAGAALAVDVVVEASEEDGPRGTAGGVAAVRPLLAGERLAVWNGDIVANIDVRHLDDVLRRDAHAVAVLAVYGREPVGGGNVGVTDEGVVVRLRGTGSRRAGRERFGAWFAAVHVLRRDAVATAPATGCLVSDVYLPMLARDAVILALAIPEDGPPWRDIGSLESYLDANWDQLAGENALVAPGATVGDEVALRLSVVGDGAHVDGRGTIDSSIVWPAARARAPLRRCVVLDDGTVVTGE